MGGDATQPNRRPPRGSAHERATSKIADSSTEAEHWLRWREDGDLRARDRLVELHGSYARSVAALMFGRRVLRNVEFEEYEQLALVGLLEAVERFDPGRGVQFRTYATWRIRGAIHGGLAKASEKHHQVATLRRLAAERTGSLVPEDIALGDPERLLTQLGDLAVSVALACILEGIGLGPSTTSELPGNAYVETEFNQLRQKVWQAMGHLPDRERQVIELHYREGRRFEEIARRLELSKGRISQLHAQAITRLRSLLSNRVCDVAY